jgi:hypothetical protein
MLVAHFFVIVVALVGITWLGLSLLNAYRSHRDQKALLQDVEDLRKMQEFTIESEEEDV